MLFSETTVYRINSSKIQLSRWYVLHLTVKQSNCIHFNQ